MKTVFVARVAALVAIAGLAFACTDRSEIAGPALVDPAPTASSLNDQVVTCTANVAARSVKCGGDNGLKGDLIYGGQHTYVNLVSSDVAVFADTIAFDVDVQNLLGQPIGTTDSLATPDPNGVRVFFVQGPTASPSGVMSVANPTGITVFTGANQPYYRYAAVPFTNEFTGSKTWKLQFSPTVQTFTFQLGISAPVEFPHGYIDGTARVLTLNPSESFTLPAKVRNALGTLQSNSPVTWTSSNPSVAAVVDSTVTGGTFGYSVLKGVSINRPTASDVYVDVCPYLNVANGTVYTDSITNSDCHSAMHPDDGFLPGSTGHGDLYRVAASAGQVIDISVDTQASGLDSYLVLADRLGNVVATNDDDEIGSLGQGSRIQFTVVTSGTYVFEVLPLSRPNTGAYTLGVQVFNP